MHYLTSIDDLDLCWHIGL